MFRANALKFVVGVAYWVIYWILIADSTRCQSKRVIFNYVHRRNAAIAITVSFVEQLKLQITCINIRSELEHFYKKAS